MRPLDEIHELLGLAADERLVEEVRIPAPATGLGHGLGSAAVDADLPSQLAAAIQRQPQCTSLEALDRHLGMKSPGRWNGDARVIAIGDAHVIARSGAAEPVPEFGWVLDTRSRSAAVVLQSPSSPTPIYISAEGGELVIGRIEFDAAAIPPFEFRDAPWINLPDLQEVLANLAVEPWLTAEVSKQASSASVLQQTASVGLVARLAMSALTQPERILSSISSGAADPLDMLRAWARALDDERTAYVESVALDEADAVANQLEQLLGAVEPPDEDALAAARLLRERRDALESVAVVLQQSGAGLALRDALEAVDRRASAHLSALDLVTIIDDDSPLLAAVSCSQPEAWWGTVWPA